MHSPHALGICEVVEMVWSKTTGEKKVNDRQCWI